MINTLKMLNQIIIGTEKKTSEKELIKEYQEKLSPNILAYFYCSNFGIIFQTANIYKVIDNDDKASFCLQELDKCLLNFNLSNDNSFITYFITCYKNRLRMEFEKLITLQRKANINTLDIYETDIEDVSIFDDIISTEDLFDNYKLTKLERNHCRLLEVGYSLKEISELLNLAPITIYKRNTKIKEKINNYYIKFA